jgi:hypothetical protein
MSNKYFSVAEAVAQIEERCDSDTDDLTILHLDHVDSLTDNELDDNGFIENHDCLPKDLPGPVKIMLQNNIFDVEDEIPLNQLLNTGKSIGNPRWRNHCNSYLWQPENYESSDFAILASKLEERTPVELFEEFLDSSIPNLIVDQSNLYSA